MRVAAEVDSCENQNFLTKKKCKTYETEKDAFGC